MKKIILFALFLPVFHAGAQDSSGVKMCRSDHEVGFNATFLMKQILSIASNNLIVSPYSLTYKYIGGNWAGRAGFGMTYQNTSTSLKEVSDPRVTKSQSVSVRLGAERQFPLGKSILAFAGLDLVFFDSRAKTVSLDITDNLPSFYDYTRITTSEKDYHFGGGAVLGIQFYINKHVSLFTEMPVYFTAGKKSQDLETYNERIDFSSKKTTTLETEFENTSYRNFAVTLPVTIFLAVKF